MRALVTAGGSDDIVRFADVEPPSPRPHEALVGVEAVSVNRGETRRATTAPDGARIGWDVAGEVVAAAADGSGPAVGNQVVGLVADTGWAEQVAVPTSQVATRPAGLAVEPASTLPVAGLTAYHCLLLRPRLDGQRVLVTGAAGGVGRFAIQLAQHGAADVTAVVGRPERADGLQALGAARVVVGMPAGPGHAGAYDLILESVGGSSLAAAFELVAPEGTIVSYGSSSGEDTTFSARSFFPKGGTQLHGYILFSELAHRRSGAADLGHLVTEMAAGRLDPQIDEVASWRQAGPLLRRLLDRRIGGKIVLRID